MLSAKHPLIRIDTPALERPRIIQKHKQAIPSIKPLKCPNRIHFTEAPFYHKQLVNAFDFLVRHPQVVKYVFHNHFAQGAELVVKAFGLADVGFGAVFDAEHVDVMLASCGVDFGGHGDVVDGWAFRETGGRRQTECTRRPVGETGAISALGS